MSELEKIKALCRYLYLTLGYYGTPYNYDSKNIAYHPITGEPASGIIADGGHDARQAMKIADHLGFKSEEIGKWPGPFGSLEEAQKFSRENRE